MRARAASHVRSWSLAALLAAVLAWPAVASAVPIRSFLVDYERPRLYFSAEIVPFNGPACSTGVDAFMTVSQVRPRRVIRDRVQVHRGRGYAGCDSFQDGQLEGSLFVGRLRTGTRYRACLRTFQYYYDGQGRERLSDHTACRVFRP